MILSGGELPSECLLFHFSAYIQLWKNTRKCILFLGDVSVKEGPPSPFSPHRHSSLTVDRLLHLHASPPSPFAPLLFHHHARPYSFTICPPPLPAGRSRAATLPAGGSEHLLHLASPTSVRGRVSVVRCHAGKTSVSFREICDISRSSKTTVVM